MKPLLTTYLGLLLMGGCFVSVGLLISSFTSNQIVAGAVTFGVFLILWVINWPAPFAPWPWLQTFLNYASIVDHFDDFSRGVLDTKHVVYYVSFIAVGPVPDRAVGGHRTVAGVVMQRALNWLAWLGVAIVFIAAPVRILGWLEVVPVSARLDQYAMYASWAGLALVVVYALQSAWAGGRNSRYGMLALVSVGSAWPSWSRSTTWRRGRTSAGTSPPTSSSRCRTRPRSCCRGSPRRPSSSSSTGRAASSASAPG